MGFEEIVNNVITFAAVPLILAKPYLEVSSDLPSGLGGVESAVLVVDDSRSMGYVHDGTPLFKAAQTQALRVDRQGAQLVGGEDVHQGSSPIRGVHNRPPMPGR